MCAYLIPCVFSGLGPMTRHAVDLKPLLKIMSGDNASKLDLDKNVDVGKLRVFYQLSNNAPMTDSVDPEITTALKKVVEFFSTKYKIEAEEKKFKFLQKSLPIWMTTMKNKEPFESLIMGKEGTAAIVLELFKNLIGCSGNTLIGLFTALMDGAGAQIGSDKYNYHLKLRDDLEKLFVEMLGDDGVFLYPTHPTPAPYHNEPLVKPFNFSYTAVINCLGLPATTIPLGLSSEGLPIGIQVVANHNNDRLCLALAEELDKAFGGWVEPRH